MSSHIYRRGAIYWWRRAVPLALPGAGHTIPIRLSLKTPVLAQARMRGGWLDMQMGSIAAETQTRAAGLTPEDLRSVFRHAFETALARYLVLQAEYPWLEEQAIRSNIAYARYYRLTASLPYEPTPCCELDQALGADLSPEERAEVQNVAGHYERGSAIGHNYVAQYLRDSGCSDSPGNVERARRTVAAAYAEACIAAARAAGSPDPRDRLPPLPSTLLTILGTLPVDVVSSFLEAPRAEVSVSSTPYCPPAADPARNLPAAGDTSAAQNDALDCPISELAQAAADHSIAKEKWSETCRGDVRGAVNLFIAANGDLKLSEIRQNHLSRMDNLISKLPRVYGKLKKGGTKDNPVFETIDEALERGEALKAQWDADPHKAALNKVPRPGLSVATRNKHLLWISSVLNFGRDNGYVKVDFQIKYLKMKDKRKKNSLRLSWDKEEMAKLLSGPVWSGCAGIDHRLVPGDTIFHDSLYFSLLLILAHGARNSEVVGLMLSDVFDQDEVPHIKYRDNAYRSLKTSESSPRDLPLPKGLIDLGFIDYCQALRELNADLVFPELWNPKQSFDKVLRDKVFYPLMDFHFPDGTERKRDWKDVDVHSIRTLATSELDRCGFNDSDKNRFTGHVDKSVTIAVYTDDPRPAHFLPLVEALWKLVPPIQPAPIRLRPQERLKFGSKPGRPKKLRS